MSDEPPPYPGSYPRRLTIIDDLSSAAELLSPLGRQLLSPAIQELAHHLRGLADECDWRIVDHRAFSSWLATHVATNRLLVSLDKLAAPPDTAVLRLQGWVSISAHRQWTDLGDLHLDLGRAGLAQIALSGATAVTLVDDAAYTGTTLAAVIEELHRLDVASVKVVVGVATARAARLIASLEHVTLHVFDDEYAAGDIIHARDLYPWLPHSGRQPYPGVHSCESLPGRIAPLFHDGGRWLSDPRLANDPVLRDFAKSGLEALEAHLQRAVMAEDVFLLGDHVAVPLSSKGMPMLSAGHFECTRFDVAKESKV